MEPYSKEWYALRKELHVEFDRMNTSLIRKQDIKPIAIWLTKAAIVAAVIITLPILAS